MLGAAADLMQESGYHAVTMQQIALRAQISVGLIYQYFGGKEDLLRALIVDVLEDFRDQVPAEVADPAADPVSRFSARFRTLCRVIDTKRAAALLAYRESQTLDRDGREQIKALELQTMDPIREAVRDGVASGVFRPVDVDLVAHTVLMVVHGWALKRWHLAGRTTLTHYVDTELELLLAALRAPGRSGGSLRSVDPR